jgi:hypothetical protein
MKYGLQYTCPNYDKPANKNEHCSKVVSTPVSLFWMSRVWRAENLRFSIIFLRT